MLFSALLAPGSTVDDDTPELNAGHKGTNLHKGKGNTDSNLHKGKGNGSNLNKGTGWFGVGDWSAGW